MTGPSRARDEQAAERLANVLVIVALVAMLMGAIVLLAARTPVVVADVPPGEERVVFMHDVPTWDVFGRHMVVRVFAVGNVTLVAEEITGSGQREENTTDLPRGQSLRWRETGEPGETWALTVTNDGNETARATGAASCVSCYWAGGLLVLVGVLGFVAYRLGMPRD